jgi:hypothetical protein
MHVVPNHLKVVTSDATKTSYSPQSDIKSTTISHVCICSHKQFTSTSPILIYMQSTTIHHHLTYIQSSTTSIIQSICSCHINTSSIIFIYVISTIHKGFTKQSTLKVIFYQVCLQKSQLKNTRGYELKPILQAQLSMSCILTSHLYVK